MPCSCGYCHWCARATAFRRTAKPGPVDASSQPGDYSRRIEAHGSAGQRVTRTNVPVTTVIGLVILVLLAVWYVFQFATKQVTHCTENWVIIVDPRTGQASRDRDPYQPLDCYTETRPAFK